MQCQGESISAPKQLNATTTAVPNVLQIFLTFNDSNGATFCYTVDARNSSHAVRVDGTLTFGKKSIIITLWVVMFTTLYAWLNL